MRPDFGNRPPDVDDGALAGEVQRSRRVQLAADGVVQLLGVYPEMDPAHAEAIGAHGGGQGLQGNGPRAVTCCARLGLQRGDIAFQAEQLSRIAGGEPVGRHADCGWIGQVTGEVPCPFQRIVRRRAQFAQHGVIGVDRG